jgi:hypothetical protein
MLTPRRGRPEWTPSASEGGWSSFGSYTGQKSTNPSKKRGANPYPAAGPTPDPDGTDLDG